MGGRAYLGIPRDRIPWWPKVDQDKCVGCGECLEVCSNEVYTLDRAVGKVAVANPNHCVVLCDRCAPFCKQEAISFPDKQETKAILGQMFEAQRETNPDSGRE